MSVAFKFAARSNIGLGRYKNNQDSGFAGPHVLAVCDGMGGHAGGDIASSIAVSQLATLDGESIGSDAPQALLNTIHAAHAQMLERVSEQPESAGMATTVTALLKFGGKLALAHIGDSRAYLLSSGTFTQITKDHTFVQWLIDQGTITEEEAAVHPQRSVITRVLGDVDASDEIDTSVREAQEGDRWLLCSDGLSSFISDATLEATLREHEDVDECVEQLIELALKGGGQDNITCVVADLVSADQVDSLQPQVVGAASLHTSQRSAEPTPATKAYALTESSDDDEEDDQEPETWWQRNPFRMVGFVAMALAAILGISLAVWGGYRWSQEQYYIGTAGDKVAIYRGINERVGTYDLSGVLEVTKLPIDAMDESNQNSVEATVSARSLDDAHRIVNSLIRQSKLCVAINGPRGTLNTAPTPTETPDLGTPVDGASEPVAPDATSDPQATSEPAPEATQPTTEPQPTPESTTVSTRPQVNYLGQPLPAECDK